MSMLSWLRRRRLDDVDLQDEIRSHVAMDIDERVARGDDPATARREALQDLGDISQAKDAARRAWTPRWLDALHDYADDVRYAVRSVAKNPAFSLAVVGVLTLGSRQRGGVHDAQGHRPYAPGRRRALRQPGGRLRRDKRRQRSARVVSRLHAPARPHRRLRGSLRLGTCHRYAGKGPECRLVWGELVTGNYFSALGVQAQLGRTLQPSDEIAPGAHPVVVISDAFWRRDLGADPAIVGTTIEINTTR